MHMHMDDPYAPGGRARTCMLLPNTRAEPGLEGLLSTRNCRRGQRAAVYNTRRREISTASDVLDNSCHEDKGEEPKTPSRAIVVRH